MHCYYYYYHYYHHHHLLLIAIEFSLGVLTLAQTIQITINIHKRNSTNNTKHSKHKYTYYHNNHTIVKTPPHTLTHKLQNNLKQPQCKVHTRRKSQYVKYPQYKVTVIYMVLCPQELHRNSLHSISLQ